ncbi:MAG: DoxX family protein [Phycisphaerales bacterium]|nr:DoxX family protein [Phycisphaerales bacterium]
MVWTPDVNMDAALLIGRCLMASLFLQSAVTKSMNSVEALDEVKSFGLPRSRVVLLPALAVQWIGAAGLIAGALTFWCAAALLAFMIPTTFIAHGFWRYTGAARAHHVTGFFQNLTMSGGLVILMATGAGRWSVDGVLLVRSS